MQSLKYFYSQVNFIMIALKNNNKKRQVDFLCFRFEHIVLKQTNQLRNYKINN